MARLARHLGVFLHNRALYRLGFQTGSPGRSRQKALVDATGGSLGHVHRGSRRSLTPSQKAIVTARLPKLLMGSNQYGQKEGSY